MHGRDDASTRRRGCLRAWRSKMIRVGRMTARVIERADDGQSTASRSGDIRSSRPYVLSRKPIVALLRRSASVASLVALDVFGLSLGLYASLALREIYHGNTPPLWGLLWEAEKAWLPFIALITVLVFWRAELYARRDSRAGFGSVLSSLVIVGVLTLAFAVGVGHRFSTYGLIPTAVVLSAVFIGLFRMSYEQISGYLLTVSGARRRALLVGNSNEVEHLRRALGSTDGIPYDFVGTLSLRGRRTSGVSRPGSVSTVASVLNGERRGRGCRRRVGAQG